MNIIINKTFSVQSDIEDVYNLLIEPESVVSCAPGATFISKIDDSTFKVGVQMKFGLIKGDYEGIGTFLARNADKKIIKLKGTDAQGNGDAQMTSYLIEKKGHTEVNMCIEINIMDTLPSFASKLINDVSNQLFDQFIDNIKVKLAGGVVDTSLHKGSLISSAIKGLFRKGK